MHQIVVDLHISTDEWLKVYRGTSRTVRARARSGQYVQFPTSILARFLNRDGIRGTFVIRYDDRGKFLDVVQLGS